MKNDKTLVLAHYYTIPEVQNLADYVGDSLELSLMAQKEKAERVVFLGVRFMAETVKILNPDAEVIIPNKKASCSLVEQTNIDELRKWREQYGDYVHVSYINSSAEHKALSDWIVTSRNVDDVIASLYRDNKKVIFSPDRNMGAYLNYTYGWDMPLWSAVCDVHDQFNEQQLVNEFKKSPQITKYLLAHPESPLSVLKMAIDLKKQGQGLVGSTSKMLNWIKEFPSSGGIFYVATEEGLLYNMRVARPDLDIRQAPIYSGCQCNVCPFMKMNTIAGSIAAIKEGKGDRIDYLSNELMERARVPVIRMLNFSQGD